MYNKNNAQNVSALPACVRNYRKYCFSCHLDISGKKRRNFAGRGFTVKRSGPRPSESRWTEFYFYRGKRDPGVTQVGTEVVEILHEGCVLVWYIYSLRYPGYQPCFICFSYSGRYPTTRRVYPTIYGST
ncbi:unnamed protein product [Laminaria digitata]